MEDENLRFLIDLGSTFTKLVVVDLDREEIIKRFQAPSRVARDIASHSLKSHRDFRQKTD